MATYILLSRLTDEGCETITKRPERIKEVNEEVEEMGGKVISQYVIFGEYDFLSVVEAPGNETIAKISVSLSSRGTIRIITMPAMDVDSFIKAFKN